MASDLVVFRNVWNLRCLRGPNEGKVFKHLTVADGDESFPVAAEQGTVAFDALANVGRPEPVPDGLDVVLI